MGESIFDLYAANDPEAQAQKAQALAALLRRQSTAGSMLALTGDKTVAPIGQQLLQQIPVQQKLMAGAPAAMQTTQLHRAQMQKIADERGAVESPEGTSALRGAAGAMSPETDYSQTPGRLLMSLMPTLEKSFAARESAAARRDAAKESAGARRFGAEQMGAARQALVADREQRGLDKRFTDFGNALNVAKGRQGEVGKSLGNLNQIESDLALIEGNPNPTKQQLYELVRGLDKSISGSAATLGGAEHLMPNTLRGMLGNGAQWLTNEPVGAGAQEFVKQIKDTLTRLKANREKFIRGSMNQSVTTYRDLAGKDEPRFRAQLESAHINPDEFDPQSWVYRGAPRVQSGAPRVTSQAEYDALPAGADYLGPDGAPHRKGGSR